MVDALACLKGVRSLVIDGELVVVANVASVVSQYLF
jgi:hypothetical protein